MALLVTTYRCAKTLRSSSALLFFSHIKNESRFAFYKRCFHICHKMKYACLKEGFKSSLVLSTRQYDLLATGASRFLSTDLSNHLISDNTMKISLDPLKAMDSSRPTLDTISESAQPQRQDPANVNLSSSEPLSNSSKITEPTAEFIPEPPQPPVQEIVNPIQDLVGEPSFESLGLGGWTPVGIIQNTLEYIHIDCSLPWWATIALGTAFVRILIFPLVIVAQRNAAKMNNYLPQLQLLQLKMTEARQTGNQLDAARYAQEMVVFMKEKNLNPLKNMLVPLAQAPLFISFFLSLRKMAGCPVESMKEGGLFWFTDLTMPDQYFLLPLLTSFTLWVTIEVGTDSAKLSSSNMQLMKYFLRAMPVIILPFTINFPGAILCYWVCSNFISLGQVAILRIPTVRDYFKIERLVNHNKDSLPIKPKGFTKGFKDSWENMKITKELEERQRYDEMQFLKAGRGPIQKTYKYDPTKDHGASPTEEKSGKSKLE